MVKRIRPRIFWGSIMSVSTVVAFLLVVLYSSDGLPFFDEAPSYRGFVNGESTDLVLSAELGKELSLDQFNSSFSVLAHKLGTTDNVAVWATKSEDKIVIKDNEWLVLDTVEVKLSNWQDYSKELVNLEVRILED